MVGYDIKIKHKSMLRIHLVAFLNCIYPVCIYMYRLYSYSCLIYVATLFKIVVLLDMV